MNISEAIEDLSFKFILTFLVIKMKEDMYIGIEYVFVNIKFFFL